MKIVAAGKAMQRMSGRWIVAGERIGFVPTMGALHAGHLALIRRARRECRRVVVSIYVNPAQFGPAEDLSRYPRPRARDMALCREAGVDVIFAPKNLYLPDHSTWVEETACSQGREGEARPGHFLGVATIVLKLFHLVQPTRAYFGQKDAQQVEVIQRMVRDLDVPVKIVVVPIIRDRDGVALSSRNVYLSPDERELARKFAMAVQKAARETKPKATLEQLLHQLPSVKMDYVTLINGRLNTAVRIGKTRLLDNEKIR